MWTEGLEDWITLAEFKATRSGQGPSDGSQPGPLCEVAVDTSHFAEMYDVSVLCLEKLTSHQREKLAECTASEHRRLHVQAPAGAGKTFVALQYMQQVLLGERGSRVLYVARR